MEHFLHAMQAQAAALDRGQGQARFGVVASTDAARHAVRVRLMPEGVLSGWLPVLTPWAGAGWGIFCAPVPGTQVLVVAQEGWLTPVQFNDCIAIGQAAVAAALDAEQLNAGRS
jgi:phage baseplate assembly protein gpV